MTTEPLREPLIVDPDPQCALYPDEVSDLSSIYTALEGVSFPATKEALLQCCGGQDIYWSEETTLTLREIIHRLPETVFSSLSDLSAAMSRLTE